MNYGGVNMLIVVLVSMVFCHIIDDFKLQAGVLNNLKQKSYWEKEAPNPMYKYDYIVALIEHAFSWTCSIHIPVLIYCLATHTHKDAIVYVVVFIFDWFLHVLIDDAKANKHRINLIQDQILHFIQIILTWVMYFMSWA